MRRNMDVFSCDGNPAACAQTATAPPGRLPYGWREEGSRHYCPSCFHGQALSHTSKAARGRREPRATWRKD